MEEPELPDGITPADLDDEARRDLRGLQKDTADVVAKHLVAAGMLVDEDPEQALAHARFARRRASRIAVVREAAGIVAYHAGEWNEALGELRAARRMGGGPGHLAVMADIERALGRPERALELVRGPEAKELGKAETIELAIVAAGARRDLGELDAAVVGLQIAELEPTRREPWSPRLFYAYADNLLAAGRESDALQWFVHAVDADTDGETDAAERIAELTGEPIDDDGVTFQGEDLLDAEADDDVSDEDDDAGLGEGAGASDEDLAGTDDPAVHDRGGSDADVSDIGEAEDVDTPVAEGDGQEADSPEAVTASADPGVPADDEVTAEPANGEAASPEAGGGDGPVDAKPVAIELAESETPSPRSAAADLADHEPAEARSGATEPVAAKPVATEPVATEPVATASAVAEPASSEPVGSEPADAEPVSVDPADAEPAAAGSAGTTSVVAEPVDMEPVDTELVDADPTGPEPTATESANTGSADTGSADTEPASAEDDGDELPASTSTGSTEPGESR